ncbi:hypothetical protein LINPERPRIM_LOCUS32642 [Linum perenne]
MNHTLPFFLFCYSHSLFLVIIHVFSPQNLLTFLFQIFWGFFPLEKETTLSQFSLHSFVF